MWSYQFPRAWAANVDLLARNTAQSIEKSHQSFLITIQILNVNKTGESQVYINKDEY
jgi:hypothetical protein